MTDTKQYDAGRMKALLNSWGETAGSPELKAKLKEADTFIEKLFGSLETNEQKLMCALHLASNGLYVFRQVEHNMGMKASLLTINSSPADAAAAYADVMTAADYMAEGLLSKVVNDVTPGCAVEIKVGRLDFGELPSADDLKKVH